MKAQTNNTNIKEAIDLLLEGGADLSTIYNGLKKLDKKIVSVSS